MLWPEQVSQKIYGFVTKSLLLIPNGLEKDLLDILIFKFTWLPSR